MSTRSPGRPIRQPPRQRAREPQPPTPPSGGPPQRRLAVSTTIFALATAISRVAGLGREVIQASYFATSVAASSFAIASQIPNLVSNLFSQAALSAAFVPIFTELLGQGRRREAFRLASQLFWLIVVVVGAITVLWMVVAGAVIPLFTGTALHGAANALTAGLSRVLFPVVLLLSITGLLVGILQSYDEFTVPALAPAVWNIVIIVLLVGLHSVIHGGPHDDKSIYAYAIAWLVATVVQMAMIAGALRKVDFKLSMTLGLSDPRVRQVLLLFLPVTVSVGIINLDAFINAELGTLVNTHAPAAINDAFRLYMLPQGIFSVAVATVLFPTLARMANNRDPNGMRGAIGNGVRQINLLMIPSMGLLAVLAVPITRLVYEHGSFGATSRYYVSTALLWFAFSLPFAGVNLLFTRTFFALKRPWIPTKLAVINILVDIVVSLALYRPLGIAGLIIGTLAANIVMTALQWRRLRLGFNGRLQGPQTAMITVRIIVASAIITAVGWIVWKLLNSLLGYSLIAQIIAVGFAVLIAGLLYARLVLLMRIPEARQIEDLLRSRLARR